jgi:hypothetical protein
VRNALPGSVALLALSVCALNAARAQAAPAHFIGGLQVVSGHILPGMTNAPVVGALPPSTTLHLTIGLPLRNRAESHSLADAVSNPASPNYRHYLTPAQYQARFSPSAHDYRAVLAFARNAHFTISHTVASRTVVAVDASVADVERALHVTIQVRRRPDRSVFYAPSNEPALALQTPILHIQGLDNLMVPHPATTSAVALNAHTQARRRGIPDAGHGPGGAYAGQDFHDAYAWAATNNGTGQCLGLFEIHSSFFPTDIASYQSAFGLPSLTPQVVLVDGYNGVPVISNGEEETALDIEVGEAMSPGLFDISVFEGDNPDDIMSAMASPPPGVPLCNQLGASWNFPVDATSLEIVEQMALQGQSFFVSSGDSGGYTSDTNDDRDLSDTTVVGGTELQLNADYFWQSEIAWPGSGGGIESNQYVPPFQQGLEVRDLGGGTAKTRLVPDVAMVADNTFLLANDGGSLTVAGTSIATALWASYTSLINEQGAIIGLRPLGFLNPALYAIAKGAGYAANFHDITVGNNGPFAATGGYDLVTGWGTPKVAILSTLNPAPIAHYTKLQITVYTGNDDLRPDSDLAVRFTGIGNLSPFCLMRSNNGNPSGVCTGNAYGDINGTQGWGSWSTQTLTYYNRFANWTWAGAGKVTLTMTSHNNGLETNDNWDLQATKIVLSNPFTGTSVTLFNVGNFSAPHNPGTCYWRFKPTGSPPVISETFKLLPGHTPGDGCPDD